MRQTGRVRLFLAAAAICTAVGLNGLAARADTIIDEWSTIKAPPAPALQPKVLDPKTTALLVMDLLPQNCGVRPRCLASIPKIAALIKRARDSHTAVIYSIVPGSTTAAILPAVAPLPNEPFVQSGPDKFIGTSLENMLKSRGITTVVPVGTASEGAVLYTASHAALLGFNVVLPVDGMSSAAPYSEQYVTWQMAHAPGDLATRVTETSLETLTF
jgi:nicotinamidase-related amidase